MGKIRNVQIATWSAKPTAVSPLRPKKGGVIENVVLRDVRLSYPTVDDPDLLPCARGA